MDLASSVILTWISFCHPFIPGPKSPMERAADSLRVDLVITVSVRRISRWTKNVQRDILQVFGCPRLIKD